MCLCVLWPPSLHVRLLLGVGGGLACWHAHGPLLVAAAAMPPPAAAAPAAPQPHSGAAWGLPALCCAVSARTGRALLLLLLPFSKPPSCV